MIFIKKVNSKAKLVTHESWVRILQIMGRDFIVPKNYKNSLNL